MRRTRGMKMRCSKANKLIGPFIDGELAAPETQELRQHLDACDGCTQRYAFMRGLVREVSSLPAIVPTPEESYRLINRLRREVAAPAAPKPASKRIQVAAAALSMLVVATVAGVSIAVWSSGGTAPVTEETAADGGEHGEALSEQGSQETGFVADETRGLGLAAATVTRPDLVVSEKEYNPEELEGFRNDLGTRLDFYSTYWYPASGGAAEPAVLEQLQGDLTDDLARQAAAAGQNPDELKAAVAVVLEQQSGEPILPCYAERAKIDGKEAWLVSVSGPEDYLLFPDRQQPPAMFLASLGGEEGLKISESLLRELAARLAPYNDTDGPLIPAGAIKSQKEPPLDGSTTSETPATTEGTPGETPGEAEAQEDFQSFLRGLAAQGTSLDLISALEGLNYEQILMLLHGDWAALAVGGVNLSDFLSPPPRLWAVDCTTNEVIWESQ